MDIYSLIMLFFISFLGTYLYRKIAISRNILANLNFRTLHVNPVPAGGGIVFSMVFVVGLFYHWWLNQSSNNLLLVLAVGGGWRYSNDCPCLADYSRGLAWA